MLAQITSAALHGVESYLVQVEVNVGSGLPSFSVVGLPEGAVREGRERVLAALQNAGAALPPRKVTVNLAPADIRKEGSAFDLPIAVGLLVGEKRIQLDRLRGWAMVGELGLDGSVRPVRGVLSIALGCRDGGLKGLIVPEANAMEAAIVEGIEVVGASSLMAVSAHLTGEVPIPPTHLDPQSLSFPTPPTELDFSEVKGQEHAKRALEVAAAGAHNLLLLGPPGSGKTMLIRRLPGILPPLTFDEAVEVTKVHSVAGSAPLREGVVSTRPFRAPHHTISDAGMVGGGASPRPGEVSLAHQGVLFLDELPEFRRNVLEALRQPLEDGWVHISRARFTVGYPARFVLAGAMNPCRCGYWGDGSERCTCDPGHVARYRARISGPLLDRIDLHLEVPAVPFRELDDPEPAASSEEIRARVIEARSRQRSRFHRASGVYANSQMGPREIRSFCRPSTEVRRLLRRALDRLRLSARAYHRILKVARTIADLEGAGEIGPLHVSEAIQYRGLDRAV